MARISSGRNKKKILQASQSKGDSVKKVYNNATTFFQKGMRKEAEQICRQILSANPAHSDALHLLGAIRYQDGYPDEAVDFIHQAIAVCNLKHHYHNTLGLALQSLGRIEDAIECFNQFLLLKPANAGGWYNLGIALDRTGKSDAAVACYHKALALRPNDAALLNGIGEAFKFHDLLEEAYACFEISLKLDSANADTMSSLGTVLKMLHRYEQAVKWFEKAIQIQPDSTDFHYNLGVVLKNMGQPERASDDKLPEQVIENLKPVTDHVDRAAAVLLNQQGEALAASGLQDEAMDHFQKAMARCPDWVVPFNNIGVVYWQSGNKAAAIKWMTKAYRIDPDHWETVQNLAEMLVQIDRSDSAFLLTQSYLQKHPENREIQHLSNKLRPPIRIIHHMARSGGTVLCKCLGCMNRILLLSEVHPLGMKWFDPLIQAYEWFDLFTGEEMDVMKRANLTFQQKVTRIYERSVSQNCQLVLRDWSHLDFTGVPFIKNPSYSLITATELQDRFHVIHLATVRHPIDQWLSLSKLEVMNNQITIDAFLYGYHRFAEFARNIGFIRYEDFTQNPQSTMQTICEKISLDYDDAFLNNWTNYTTITGDTRSERVPDACIRTMPRRPVEKKLLKLFASSSDYWNSLSILGYDHQE
jgi:tetratricopeptide (TPR) repeat protein